MARIDLSRPIEPYHSDLSRLGGVGKARQLPLSIISVVQGATACSRVSTLPNLCPPVAARRTALPVSTLGGAPHDRAILMVLVPSHSSNVVPACRLMAHEALVDFGIFFASNLLRDHPKVFHVVTRRSLMALVAVHGIR